MSYETSITFRLNEDEKGKVANAAAAQNLSLSDYVRARVLGTQPTFTLRSATGALAASANTTVTSTPQTVYAALDSRVSSLEAQIEATKKFLRED